MSDEEILALLIRKWRDILIESPWSFLLKTATGTVTASGIALPADFSELIPMEHNIHESRNTPTKKGVFIGSYFVPAIAYSARKQQDNADVCWWNPTNSTIEFANDKNGSAYTFDYKYRPDSFTTTTVPVFERDMESVIVDLALLDAEVIAMSEKARSNAQMNTRRYRTNMENMRAKLFRQFFA